MSKRGWNEMPSPDLTYCRATITSEPSGLALFLEVVTAHGDGTVGTVCWYCH